MSRALQAVREAAIDGRLRNTTYRQIQLEKLQKILIDNADSVERAIKSDSECSYAEAAVEFILSLQTVRDYYSLLDEDDALDKEYAIATGKDVPSGQEAIGIVYVVPSTHTPFYSTILAVVAAISSGNCVVLEFKNALLQTPKILQTLLSSALDRSIVAFVSSHSSDADLGPNHIRLFQKGSLRIEAQTTSIVTQAPAISPFLSRVVAVVDRTADVVQAARDLVTARLSFRGGSPYSPDLVLVNEYVKESFLVAVMDAVHKLTASLSGSQIADTRSSRKMEDMFADSIQKNEIELMTSTSRAAVYNVKSRDTKLLRSKISGSNLLIFGVRSLDDAINAAGSDHYLASYIFAAASSAKYVNQFIMAQSSFINQAPPELLVGPACPRASADIRSLRYPLALFSMPRGHFVTKSVSSQELGECLCRSDPSTISKSLKLASTKLEPKKKRSAGGQIGFFEQGVLTGLATYGAAGCFGLGTIVYAGIKLTQRLRC